MAQITEPGVSLVTTFAFGVGTQYLAFDGVKGDDQTTSILTSSQYKAFDGVKTVEEAINQKYSEKMQTSRGSRLMFLTNEVAGNNENLAIPTVQYWG